MDWSLVTTRLACGGSPDTNGIRGLMRYGFTHVLDLRHTTTNTDLYWMNFVYFRNPTIDDGGAKPLEWFERSLSYAMPIMSNPRSRLYVGCHSGINRAPSTVYLILRCQGWGQEAAFDLVTRQRPDSELSYAYQADLALERLM